MISHFISFMIILIRNDIHFGSARSCEVCKPESAPVHPSNHGEDYILIIQDHSRISCILLLQVPAYSKWMEVFQWHQQVHLLPSFTICTNENDFCPPWSTRNFWFYKWGVWWFHVEEEYQDVTLGTFPTIHKLAERYVQTQLFFEEDVRNKHDEYFHSNIKSLISVYISYYTLIMWLWHFPGCGSDEQKV